MGMVSVHEEVMMMMIQSIACSHRLLILSFILARHHVFFSVFVSLVCRKRRLSIYDHLIIYTSLIRPMSPWYICPASKNGLLLISVNLSKKSILFLVSLVRYQKLIWNPNISFFFFPDWHSFRCQNLSVVSRQAKSMRGIAWKRLWMLRREITNPWMWSINYYSEGAWSESDIVCYGYCETFCGEHSTVPKK